MSKIIIEIENGLAAPKWVPGVIQRYDRNHFRNEFFCHENISIDTWIEILCAMVCVLCHYVYENTEIGEG